MCFISNIIWFLSGGGVMGLFWYFAGTFWTITIIGIPLGKQCFKSRGRNREFFVKSILDLYYWFTISDY